MKRFFAIFITAIMLLTLSACNQTQSNEQSPETSSQTPNIPSANSIEEVEAAIEKDVDDTITALNSEWEELQLNITTYEEYSENVEAVEEFYDKVYTTTEQLCIRIQEYTVQYAELIMSSDMSNDDKYDEFGEIYDCIYDDACDEVYDSIYDGILKDIYDKFYDEILKDAYDSVPYKEWSDFRSDEYKWWSNTRSDVYKDWSNTRSDIYGFVSDMRSDLYDDDIEDAEKTLDDYKKDVEKLKK